MMVAVNPVGVVRKLNAPVGASVDASFARHGEVLFDPFHKGRILTKADCEEILTRQNLRLRAVHLEPATPRQILLRVLANLLYVYDLRKELEKHTRVNAWIKALSRER